MKLTPLARRGVWFAVGMMLVAVQVWAGSIVLVEDTFDGTAGAPPNSAFFDWSGQAGLSGAGQLNLSTGTTNNGTLTLTSYVGPGGNLVIPDTLYGYPVVSLGNNAFLPHANLTNLTSVTIPGTVTNIGTAAFQSCTGLTNAVIPGSVASVGMYAFRYCASLRTVTLGTGIVSLGDYAFYQCTALAGLVVPSSVTRIGTCAFSYCNNLRQIAIPGSVTQLGHYAFSDCQGLTNAIVEQGAANLGDGVFQNCPYLRRVVLPESVILGSGMNTFMDYAFYGCSSLRGVFFQGNLPSTPSGVNYAFTGAGNATVYYLAGATGWDSTYGGRPAVLWNPLPHKGDSSFGIRTNGSVGSPSPAPAAFPWSWKPAPT